MDLTKTVELFEELRSKISEHHPYLAGNETVTRVLLVDPVLDMLGWEVRNPNLVVLEFEPAETKRDKADYVLRSDTQKIAVVEAKKLGVKIDDLKHREQADGYARYAEVKFFILTNGQAWRLYERDLMTSIERLEPIVTFDLVNEQPESCALKALSLWKSNLGLGSTPTPAGGPVLEPMRFEKGPITPPKSGKAVDTGWYPLSNLKIDNKGKKINRLKIHDQEYEVSKWTEFTQLIGRWLVQSGRLQRHDCPVIVSRSKTKCSVNTTATHPDGKAFALPKELPNGLWIETNRNARQHVEMSQRLITKFGENPDAVKIHFA